MKSLLTQKEFNHLIEPKDKQNVQAAVKLFQLIYQKINKIQSHNLSKIELDDLEDKRV